MLLDNVNLRIAISSQCNLNCLYCEGSRGFRNGKPGAMEDFRKKPLKDGCIDEETLIKIIKLFHKAGFIGVTLTGGEPMLNPNWDKLVEKIAEIGMSRVEMTTNGTLLSKYFKKNKKLPKGLTLIKISLDTIDPHRFKKITNNGDINKVIEGIKNISPHTKIRTNKVLLKSDMDSLLEYFDFCKNIGIYEVLLLDLIIHNNRHSTEEKKMFEKEYVSYNDVVKFFKKNIGINIDRVHKYGHATSLPNGLNIIIKDSQLAIRNDQCLKCPIYCQEGIYTVRIGTDGNITICPDYMGELISIDGPLELKNGTLFKKIKDLAVLFQSANQIEPFDKYCKFHNLKISEF